MYQNFLLYDCWIILSHQAVDNFWGCCLGGQRVSGNFLSYPNNGELSLPHVMIFLYLTVEDESLSLSGVRNMSWANEVNKM